MKKFLLSALAVTAMVFGANAVTYMRVHTSDGQIKKYDVENVSFVDYEDTTSADTSKSDTTGTTDMGGTVSGMVGNYAYVDLGLKSGTKWATLNVGATKPTENGDHFSWGETASKTEYSMDTYKWNNAFTGKQTKYCLESENGTVDSLTVLESADDAATANWGAEWRMPTTKEQQELIDGCDWEWTSNFTGSGVAGYIGTSQSNGNIIFFPAAGYYDGTTLDTSGSYGYYWSSSLSEYQSYNAAYFYFYNDFIDWTKTFRYCGFSVRAVVK